MLYSDLYGKLAILTGRSDITHVEIGRCINLEKGAVTARAKRNANIKKEELIKIEEAFGIKINDITVCSNSLKKSTGQTAGINIDDFACRLAEIQQANSLSDRETAKLLGIYEDDYIDLKTGEREINIKILNKIKQNFQVSIDWLLYGC